MRVGSARHVVVVVCCLVAFVATRAHAQDTPDGAEPPAAPAQPPGGEVGPATPGGDGTGWDPDQRGFTEPQDEPPPAEPNRGGDAGGGSSGDVMACEADYASAAGPSLFLDVGLGTTFIDLGALSEHHLLPQSVDSDAFGGVISLGGGMNVGPMIVGVSGSYTLTGAYDLAAAEIETGARLPIPLFGRGHLGIRLAAGWTWMTDSSAENAGTVQTLPVGGPIVELGASADTWISDDVTLGLAADTVFTILHRRESTCDAPSVDGECLADGIDFAAPGSATGFGVRLRVDLGLHF